MAKKQKISAAEGLEPLKADLRSGQFRRMYVFFGAEDYLLSYYRRQLRKKLVDGPAEDFNLHRFNEESWDIAAVSEAVEAIPMMSETSLVEILDVDPFARPESERSVLAELFENLPEYCTILWVFDALDWKPDKRMKKLWEPMDRAALQVEFPRQTEAQLVPWVRRHLMAGKKDMPDNLIRYLILQTGGSMTILSAELQKLLSYSDQPTLTKNDVDAVVIPVMEAAIFDITRTIGRRDFDGALGKLRDLIREDTDPIAINAVIGRQMRQLYGAKVLAEHGKGPGELARICGTWDSAARELYSQARDMKKQTLKEAMLLSARTDQAMKTGGGDNRELLENMVLRIARSMGAGR